MRKRYRTIARANRAWGTAFGSFDAVRPPSVRDEAPMAFRRDWLLFRRNGIYDFILESAKTIRDLDPHRIVMVYPSTA
jgi:beta-galactosidase GanA